MKTLLALAAVEQGLWRFSLSSECSVSLAAVDLTVVTQDSTRHIQGMVLCGVKACPLLSLLLVF